MKTKLIILSILCSFLTLTAQNDQKPHYSHQFGIHAGLTTGVGLSYRFWPGKIGIQATFVPFKTESDWVDLLDIQEFYEDNFDVRNQQFISTGLTGLLEIKKFEHSKLFGYWGNHMIFEGDNTIYNTGIGVGFSIETRVSFNLMAGYGGFDLLNSLNLYPTLEMGVYYRFNKFGK